MTTVLIIDDDSFMCHMLSDLIRRMGHDSVCRHSADEGLSEAFANPYDIVLLDVHMPDGSGLDILPKIRQAKSNPEVIIITGFGDAEGAEIAIKNGAWDYIQKTDSTRKLQLQLKRVIQYRQDIGRKKKPPVVLELDGIIGGSPKMKVCHDLLAQAAASDINVHISGETGTGKELFARAVHANSERRDRNFVIVDCGALPENLIESLLFGHTRGAFTGADSPREGLIAQAHEGTLFLDEIGELPFPIQKVLLRVLQEGKYRPIGGKSEKASDFRLVSATNKNLDDMVGRRDFRQDLLYRIRGLVIDLPPLKERREDIREIAFFHINELCARYRIGGKGFSPEFMEMLNAYPWPGNVRELHKALESAISAAWEAPVLFPVHLPTHIRTQMARVPFETEDRQPAFSNSPDTFPPLRELLDQTENRYLKNLVGFAKGDIREICRISGLSRSRLYDRLKKYKIKRRA